MTKQATTCLRDAEHGAPHEGLAAEHLGSPLEHVHAQQLLRDSSGGGGGTYVILT
jgi:hypothetical protein